MKLISAISQNGIIGARKSGQDIIPWHYSADFKHFKQKTLNKTVVMGDITYNSIIGISGKPLPNRRSVVLTKAPFNSFVEQYNSIPELLDNINKEDSWIIGGRSIYEQFMPMCEELHLTIVPDIINESDYDFVVRFPFINPSLFKTEIVSYLDSNLKYVIMKRI